MALTKTSPQQTEQELRNYLGSFAFHGDKVNQPIQTFSGGEKARYKTEFFNVYAA